LGLITINALTAAEELIVPIQCEYYALEGLGQLLRNVSLVQQNINPELRLTGIVMTMFDPRTRLSEQVVDEVRRFFGDLVYDNIIPRTVRLSEAPGFGLPITAYDPKSKGAQSYRDLAREVALRPPPDTPMPAYDEMPTMSVPNLSDAIPTTEAPVRDETDADEGEPDEALDEPSEHPPESAAVVVDTPVAPASEPAAPPQEQPPMAVAEPAPEPAVAVPDADDEIWEAPEPTSKVRPAPQPVTGSAPDRRVVVIDEDAELGGGAPVPKPGGSVPDRAESIGATLHDDDGQRRRWRLFRKGGE
jgi:hypothetical protein